MHHDDEHFNSDSPVQLNVFMHVQKRVYKVYHLTQLFIKRN